MAVDNQEFSQQHAPHQGISRCRFVTWSWAITTQNQVALKTASPQDQENKTDTVSSTCYGERHLSVGWFRMPRCD